MTRVVGRGRSCGQPADGKMGTIELAPVGVAILLSLRQRGYQFVYSLWDPSWCLIGTLSRSAIRVRGGWPWGSSGLSVGWLAWPGKRKRDVVVGVVVRTSVSMGIGGRIGACVFSDRRCRNLAHISCVVAGCWKERRSVVKGWQRCRPHGVRSVSYHYG